MNSPTLPRFVILCGPSGCGKSTLARLVQEALGSEHCRILSTDHYYKDLSHLPPSERTAVNFDQPEALDAAKFLANLQELALGKIIEIPQYNFVTHTRNPCGATFAPARWILVEGIFAQSLLQSSSIPALVVYLDLPAETCLARRIQRDQKERGRSPQEIETRFRRDILPSIEKFILPQKEHANLVLDATLTPKELNNSLLEAINSHPFAA